MSSLRASSVQLNHIKGKTMSDRKPVYKVLVDAIEPMVADRWA